MHQVDVMTSNVGESIGILAGAPVLKIGVAIVPFLHQAGGTEAKLTKVPRTILATRHQTSVVKPLVILDPDEEASTQSLALDGLGFLRFHHQGLDYQKVLSGFERRHR